MRQLFGICTLLALANPVMALTHGFYAGLGGGFANVSEDYQSTFFMPSGRSGYDTYDASANRLAPYFQVGYWRPFTGQWLWGVAGSWKYLGYQTANVDGEHGQHLPSASFSSINFFGPDVIRDFNSQTTISNEALLLFYLGTQLQQSYIYLGVGPAFFTASNSIYLSSVHLPNRTGNHLVSTSVTADTNVWGAAAQIGYNYFFDTNWFASINYTYIQTANGNFNNNANTATFNGAAIAGPNTLHLNRSINWSAQEVTLSINRVFW